MKRTAAILLLMMLSLVVSAQDSLHQELNVVIFGDSNTWLGGDNCYKPKGWNTYFKKEFGAKSCVSLARSGATWTNTIYTQRNIVEYTTAVSHCNVIYNQILRLKNQVDKGTLPSPHIILIAAGTNDGWFIAKRPGVFNKTAAEALADSTITQKNVNKITTLAESVVYGCKILSEYFPNAMVVLMTPMQTIMADDDTIMKIGDIIEECGNALGLPVIRQDKETPVVSAQERVQKRYTYDGTHTSELGAQENGKIISEKVSGFWQLKHR